jgi:hypothetical protein
MKALSNHAECPSCGGGHKSKPFCLYENGWHCFACGYTKSSDRSFTPALDKHKHIPDLPPHTNNISLFSLSALEWLRKFNISDDDIYQYKIYSCTDDDSLLFVNNTGWQSRNIQTREIKTGGFKSPLLLEVDSDICIIVEDYISAINIHKAGYNVICLWGTKISYAELSRFKQFKTFYTWLDNDKSKKTNSGQEAAAIIGATIKSLFYEEKTRYGFTLNNYKWGNIITDKDPKYYLKNEILENIKAVDYTVF